MQIIRKILLYSLLSLIIILGCCNYIGNKAPSLDSAENQFISESQIMTEQDALSQEITWYKVPQITEREISRNLNGKDVIHEMNLLLKENENTSPDGLFGLSVTWNAEWIAKAKNYAVSHPDDIIATEYYFTGVFANYDIESKYSTIRKRLLYIYKPVDQWWDFYVSSN